MRPSQIGQPNDGLLSTNEILEMKLNASLVVLSPCDKGRGQITGDGVIGLSRSFITAGVPNETESRAQGLGGIYFEYNLAETALKISKISILG